MEQRQVAMVLREVARQTQVPVEEMCGPGRSAQQVTARYIACLSLAGCGLRPTQIARILHKNHSTVVHALEHANDSGREEWHRIARLAHVAAGYGDPLQASDHALRRVPLSAADRAAALAYIGCVLLGMRRASGPTCVSGLWILSRTPGAWSTVRDTLCLYQLDAHVQRLRRHAAQLGYPLAAA